MAGGDAAEPHHPDQAADLFRPFQISISSGGRAVFFGRACDLRIWRLLEREYTAGQIARRFLPPILPVLLILLVHRKPADRRRAATFASNSTF